MKLQNYLLLLACIVVFASCNDRSVNTIPQISKVIVGDWKISEFKVSSVNETKSYIYDNFYNASFNVNESPILLSILENSDFRKNFTTGTWNLSNNNLKFIPNKSLKLPSESYEIIEVIQNTLSLKIRIRKKNYSYPSYIKDFESDDLIYITEKYIRKQ